MDSVLKMSTAAGIPTKSINNIFKHFSVQPTEIWQFTAIFMAFFGHFRGLKLYFTGVEHASKRAYLPKLLPYSLAQPLELYSLKITTKYFSRSSFLPQKQTSFLVQLF